jgi:hypothetical protein
MRVFNEESIFISLEKCFCTVFFEFVEVILTAHARQLINLYTQGSYTSYEHYCLCLGWPCARRSFKKVVFAVCRECWAVNINGMAIYVTNNPYPPAHD